MPCWLLDVTTRGARKGGKAYRINKKGCWQEQSIGSCRQINTTCFGWLNCMCDPSLLETRAGCVCMGCVCLKPTQRLQPQMLMFLTCTFTNNALGNTCSLARQVAWGLGGIGRPNLVHSLTVCPYGVRLRHLLSQTGGEVITIYLITSGQLSCQD